MDNFVIVTATKYENNNDPRFFMAEQTIGLARLFRYRIVVVDDSPDPAVARAFVEKEAVLFRQEVKGFGYAVRQAICEGAKLAGPDGIVAWQEPEKIDMLRHYKVFVDPILKNEADMVIPRRTDFSLSTYPAEQVLSEKLLNHYAWLLSGKKLALDLGSGVRVFKTALAHFFEDYDGAIWDTLVIPVIRAVKANCRIESIGINYIHPRKQKEIEEGNTLWCEKRLTQLQHLIPLLKKEWGK